VTAERSAVGDLRRSQVIAAAGALVAEGGLEALTFGALEKELPFTRGVITWHFADKAALLAAVLDHALAEIDRETAAEVDAHARFDAQIRAVIQSKVDGFLRRSEATRVMMAFWSGGGSGEIAPLFQRWRRQGAGLARAAIDRGEARGDLDPEAFGAILVGLVIGVVVQAQYAGPIDHGAAVALAVDAAVGAAH
jgi:AcrR family transcriptional regulator